jgi:hypothetical protein
MAFKFKRDVASHLLASDETFAFTLMTILLAEYDQEVFDENPVVLFNRIEEDFRTTLPEEAENRINAAITAMTTDLFYTQFSAFKAITLALNEGDLGDLVDGDDNEDLNAAEILWAITEVGLLNGDNFAETQEKLSESVAIGCNAIIDDEAEEEEEIADTTDTIMEAIKEPYYQQYVTINLLELARQLAQLGVSAAMIEELLQTYNRSLKEQEMY